MKKKYRLKKSLDFKKVLDYRHLAGKNDSMSIYFAPNELGYARIGISVSTKIGDAVIRARVRRQIRSMINLCDVLTKSVDVVILTRPGFLQKTFQENLNLLSTTFVRLEPHVKKENK